MDEQTRAQANELYWDSDESVGQISDRLEISRRALYDSIDPRPADVACPECGGPLGFRNRTAADRREAECRDCGHEQSAPAREQSAPTSTGAADEAPDSPEIERDARAARLAPLGGGVAAAPPGTGPLLGGAMLAGLAVGAAVAYVVKRR